jgi:hypothetical protein
MTGLAVECALKSCLASEVKECDFPDKQFVNSMYVHDLESLFKLNGALWARLQSDIKADAELNGNWRTVKDWDNGKRYEVVEEFVARALYKAATQAGSGVMAWIHVRW